MATTMRTRSLLAIVLCASVAALAQAPAQPLPAGHPAMGKAAPGSVSPHARAPVSPWAQLGDYTLTVKVPPKGDAGTWKFRTFDDPADVIVELDTPAPKGRTRGSILLVDGRLLATKGFTPEPGFEPDPLDAAVVNLKILTRLLDAAVPGGPVSVKGRQAVAARDDKGGITAYTPTAEARFNAPWSLTGNVARVDANTISFQLALEVPGARPADRERWAFSGTASGSQKGRVLDEAMSLSGWTAYALGSPKSAKSGAHTSLRFGAAKLPGPFATLKDLRAAQP